MSPYLRATLWVITLSIVAACNAADSIDFTKSIDANQLASMVKAFLYTAAVSTAGLLDMKNQPPDS